mgnify:CR=1 FL=1
MIITNYDDRNENANQIITMNSNRMTIIIIIINRQQAIILSQDDVQMVKIQNIIGSLLNSLQ